MFIHRARLGSQGEPSRRFRLGRTYKNMRFHPAVPPRTPAADAAQFVPSMHRTLAARSSPLQSHSKAPPIGLNTAPRRPLILRQGRCATRAPRGCAAAQRSRPRAKSPFSIVLPRGTSRALIGLAGPSNCLQLVLPRPGGWARRDRLAVRQGVAVGGIKGGRSGNSSGNGGTALR